MLNVNKTIENADIQWSVVTGQGKQKYLLDVSLIIMCKRRRVEERKRYKYVMRAI